MAAGLDNVPPFIASQLSHLLSHFKVEQMWSSDKYNSPPFDRFTLLIPYCLDYIKWDVIYNPDSPNAAPDVIFGPEDDDFHPFHMYPSAQLNDCLSDWSYKDPTRLLTLIQFLRGQYVLYQRKRVGEVDDDRLKFEVSTIISREAASFLSMSSILTFSLVKIPKFWRLGRRRAFTIDVSYIEGIEMHMSSGAEKLEEVKFAVPLLDININKMVPCCPWRYPQKIHLQVVYPVGRKYMSPPSAPRLKLVSSSELKALYSTDDFKLPPWLDGMCLAEYLPNLEEYLGKQVLEAVSLIEVRRHFIEALACPFGRPVEADSVFCRKATFLSASGVFTFLVHFKIPIQFPKQQPTIMLQSSQHFNSQMAPMKSRLISDYPWSPRWEPLQMAERICEFLADEALNFKRQCSEGQVQ